MARVTYGPEVTEYAGSIGGVTFQKNRSGNIARLRPNPTVNPTSLQAGYQTNMSKLVAYWPTLSQDDKDDWDTFAAAHDHTTPWGETKTLSGYQWFLSCNLNRLLSFATPISSPPAWTAWSPPQAFTLTAAAGYLYLNWSPEYNPNADVNFYLTLPLRQSSIKLRRSLFHVWRISLTSLYPFINLTVLFEDLANVSWSDFYVSANCSIICRINRGSGATGLFSAYTSAIIKIG
jgi:hypothetical protein